MPKAYPPEFRSNVIAVARRGTATVSQVAADFGISGSCLQRWLAIDDRRSAGGDGASDVPISSSSGAIGSRRTGWVGCAACRRSTRCTRKFVGVTEGLDRLWGMTW